MRTTEIRPLPVNKTVVIRSSFFALAKLGAELHSYDEQNGIITATIGMLKIGSAEFFDQGIEVSVSENDETSLLKVVAPNQKSAELLKLIANYVVEGGKAIKDDAHIQWFELLKQEESRRQREEKKQAWDAKVNNLVQKIPFLGRSQPNELAASPNADENLVSQPPEEKEPANALIILSPETKAIAPLNPKNLNLTIPGSPGMLIKNRYGEIFEIQVDTVTCSDRTRYLLICPYCSTTNIKESWFCLRCGKQLTVIAASDEIKRKVISNANTSLWAGLLSLVPGIIFLLIGAIPLMLASSAVSLASVVSAFISSLSSVTSVLTKGLLAATLPALLFVALPSFLLGRKAISSGQQALMHLNLNFYADQAGKTRANIGQAAGYLGMYTGIGFFILVLLSGYLRGG
jgi:hypothetical protein